MFIDDPTKITRRGPTTKSWRVPASKSLRSAEGHATAQSFRNQGQLLQTAGPHRTAVCRPIGSYRYQEKHRRKYGGWKKSYTTLDGWNPVNNGINHLSTGAGFLPSTVRLFSPTKHLKFTSKNGFSPPENWIVPQHIFFQWIATWVQVVHISPWDVSVT